MGTVDFNQSINQSICRRLLTSSSRRRLRRVCAPKQKSLQSTSELFPTDVVGSKVGGEIVPSSRGRRAETARSEALSSSPWLNHIATVRRSEVSAAGHRSHWATDALEICRTRAVDAVERHQRNFVLDALRHRQPVQRVAQCRRDVVVQPRAGDESGSCMQHCLQVPDGVRCNAVKN